MSIVQSLQDRLLARAARLTAQVAATPAAPPVAPGLLAVEAQAFEAALAAFTRGDLSVALGLLQPVIGAARRAETLALHAHLMLTQGLPQEARAGFERALALEPGNVSALDGLAALLLAQGEHGVELRLRIQRLVVPASFGPREAIAAIAALARATRSGGEMTDGDLELITRQFDRVIAQASVQERSEFAEWLFALKPGQGRARSLIEQTIIQDVAWGTRLLGFVTQADVPRKHMLRLHEAGDEGLAGVPLRVAELADAAVLADFQWSPWLPLHGKVVRGYATRRGLTARQKPGSTLLMQNSTQLLARLPIGEHRRVEGPAILVGGAENHYQFVVEHLSRVAVLEKLGFPVADTQWVVDKSMLPYHREYFELLGIPSERLLPASAGDLLTFAHLIAAVPLGRGPRMVSTWMPAWTRKELVAKAGASLERQPSRRIYLTPADGRAQVANDDELAAALASRGFEHVREKDFSVAALISLFAQACELVSPLSPALTYMLYMPAGGTVTALYNSHLPATSDRLEIDYLATACGHRMRAVPGEPASGDASSPDESFKVDGAKVFAHE
jgi:hypothetical protein